MPSKKATVLAKKHLAEGKKTIENKPKASQQNAAEKVMPQTPVVHMNDHKKELKKALTKAKNERRE